VDPQKIPQQPKDALAVDMPGNKYFNEDNMTVEGYQGELRL
jgi:hypothetical protein